MISPIQEISLLKLADHRVVGSAEVHSRDTEFRPSISDFDNPQRWLQNRSQDYWREPSLQSRVISLAAIRTKFELRRRVIFSAIEFELRTAWAK